AAAGFQIGIGQGRQKLQLLGVAEHDPGQAARPGGERGVPLLGIGAAVAAVGGVENDLVGGAAAQGGGIVAVASLAVEQGELGGYRGVIDQAAQEADAGVLFAQKHVAQLMTQGQRAQRPYGVGEKGV